MNRTIKILARGEMTTRSKKGEKVKKTLKIQEFWNFPGVSYVRALNIETKKENLYGIHLLMLKN